jgi:ABC-type sugar transport system permease subunit
VKRNPKKCKLSSDAVSAYLLILPFFLFFAVFVLYPILQNFANSLTNDNLATREFIGFANYARLLRDKSFLHAVANTFVYAACSIAPLMALGFLAALAVNGRSKALLAARAALIYPYVASLVAVSMVWLFLYEPGSGILNKLLGAVGLPRSDWLFDEKLALPCLIAMNVWKNMGYVMILYLAALQSVPQSLTDAARVDGAGFFRRTWHVALPSIRPVSYFLLATLSIECFKTFDQVRIMTNGGPVDATTTITHQIYIRAFSEFKMGYASAMSVVLFAIVLAITLLSLRFGGQLGRRDGGD